MIDLKKVSLTIGIAVIFAFLVFSIIDLFYEQPEWDDFCGKSERMSVPVKLAPPDNCSYVETPLESCYENEGMVRYKYDAKGCPVEATCDYCQKDYNDARERYHRNLFYISAPIGIIALILGMYLPLTVEAIASGFMFGGIAVLFVGTIRVFGDLTKIGRVITLSLELALIVWLGYRKVSDAGLKKSKRKK